MAYHLCKNCTKVDSCFNSEEEYEELVSALMNIPSETLGMFFLENGCGNDFRETVEAMRCASCVDK